MNRVRITVGVAINLPELRHQLVSVFDHRQANSLFAVGPIKEAMVPEVMLTATEADLSRVAKDDHCAPYEHSDLRDARIHRCLLDPAEAAALVFIEKGEQVLDDGENCKNNVHVQPNKDFDRGWAKIFVEFPVLLIRLFISYFISIE